MTTETRADFARRLGVNRSTVTRWAERGQIVMDGDLVDVEASQQRLRDTGGARPDVAERHAAARGGQGAVPPAPTFPPPSAPSGDERVGNTYQAARAVKEKYAAMQARLDYEKSVGNLIEKEASDRADKEFGASVRVLIEAMPDQLAPMFPGDIHENHAILHDHARVMLASVDSALLKKQELLKPK